MTTAAQGKHLSAHDYGRLCRLIYEKAGIELGSERRTMLEARMNRRLKALSLPTYAEYCEYLFSARGQLNEIVPLIEAVTTHKTDFFREPRHFDFLVGTALPEWMARYGTGRPFSIWSAGCSTGEEPYTMAILLSEFAQAHPGFRFQILATDISTPVLEKAELGVYTSDMLEPVPAMLRRKYFMRSRDRNSNQVRVVPELRDTIEFRRLNFIDGDYGIAGKMDAIFCRNVIIYFDRPTQQRILLKLALHLQPQAYLFVGHSETLHDMNLPVVPVAPALYRRRNEDA